MNTRQFSWLGICCSFTALATIVCVTSNTQVIAETKKCPLYKKIVKEARDQLGWKTAETREFFYCEHSFEENPNVHIPAFLLRSNEAVTLLHHLPCGKETASTGFQIYVYGTEKLEILTEGQSNLYANLYDGRKETFHGYEARRTSVKTRGVNKRELKWKVGNTWFIVNRDIATCNTLTLEDPDQLAEALYKTAAANGLGKAGTGSAASTDGHRPLEASISIRSPDACHCSR